MSAAEGSAVVEPPGNDDADDLEAVALSEVAERFVVGDELAPVGGDRLEQSCELAVELLEGLDVRRRALCVVAACCPG